MDAERKPRDDEGLADVDASSLRVFSNGWGGASASPLPSRPGDRPDWTLSEFFERWMAPRLTAKGRDERTLIQYRESLALWEPATGSPGVRTIADSHAAAFLNALRARKWRGESVGPNTIRKHVTHVQAALDRLLAPTRRHPFGAGLRDDVPLLDRPASLLRDVDASAMTREELERVWRAIPVTLGGSGRTRRVAAWRLLFQLAYVSAMRLEALRKCESSWLVDDDLSREFGGRWLAVPAHGSKTSRPYRVFLPRSASELVARLASTPGRWFALCCRGRSQFFADQKLLAKAAGLRKGAAGVHAIRKLAATELAALNPSAAAMQLGHAGRGDTTLNHYTGRRVQAEWVDKRPPWLPE